MLSHPGTCKYPYYGEALLSVAFLDSQIDLAVSLDGGHSLANSQPWRTRLRYVSELSPLQRCFSRRPSRELSLQASGMCFALAEAGCNRSADFGGLVCDRLRSV